ncbi:hypothetical protein ACI8AC_00095 [Geodermatophilus sp. SYSU D00758]
MTAAALGTGLSARGHQLPAAAAAAVATALLWALPEQAGSGGRLAAVAVLQVALSLAWVPATGVHGGRGAPLLGVAAALGADLLLVVPEEPEIGVLLAVPGAGFLAAVLHQMLRRPPRREVVGSLAGVLLLVCAVTALALLLRLEPTGEGSPAVTTAVLVVGATLVTGALVDLVLPRPSLAPGVARGVPALVLSVLAGAAVALLRRGGGDLLGVVTVLLAGLLLAGVAALVGLVADYTVAGGARRTWAAAVVQAVLPFAAVAPVAFSLVLQDVL